MAELALAAIVVVSLGGFYALIRFSPDSAHVSAVLCAAVSGDTGAAETYLRGSVPYETTRPGVERCDLRPERKEALLALAYDRPVLDLVSRSVSTPAATPRTFQISRIETSSRLAFSPGGAAFMLVLTPFLVALAGLSVKRLVPRADNQRPLRDKPIVGLTCLGFSMSLGVWATWLASTQDVIAPQVSLFESLPPQLLWIFFVMAATVVPFVEEWFFRGVLLARFHRGAEQAAGAVALSATFAAMHTMLQPGIAWFVLFAASMIFSFASIQTGSWRWAAICHAGFNAAGILAAVVVGAASGQ